MIASNLEQKKIPAGKLIETKTTIDKVETADGDAATFSGTIHMLDYMKEEPITLNCIVHIKTCPLQSNTYLFHKISPKPFTDSIWKSLDQIWNGFSCTGNR